jgi:hypothetical protein
LTQATIFYITLTCSVLLPFLMMLVTFVYWFVCAPRSKALSCGRELRRSPLCPDRNPLRVQQQRRRQNKLSNRPLIQLSLSPTEPPLPARSSTRPVMAGLSATSFSCTF